MKILNPLKISFISKSYVEGIYADTPANRKLGRVGMTYTDYNAIIKDKDNKAIYFHTKQNFDNKEEVLNWINEYISKFNGVLDTKRTKEFVKLFEKRYEVEGEGEKILRGLINHDSFKYGYDGGFDTNFGLYTINFRKKEEKEKPKSQEEKIKEYVSSVKNKETRKLTEEAVRKMIELGVNIEDLPPIEYKYIEKQQGIHPLAGYDSSFNKLLISSRHDFKEVADKIYKAGYNSQPNPILHEFGHWLIHKTNSDHWLHKKNSVPLLKTSLEKISGRAAVSRAEFEAELIAGILAGNKYDSQIMMNSDLRFNKDEISKKIYQMGIDGEDKVWKNFHKIDAKVTESTKKRLQSFLNRLNINAFQLGYGGYDFIKEGDLYTQLNLSDIREKDLKEIENKLKEEKLTYRIKYKTMSSKEGIIKNISILFE